LGYRISDFGELQVPDVNNHHYSLSNTLVKNPLQCGTVSEKVG